MQYLESSDIMNRLCTMCLVALTSVVLVSCGKDEIGDVEYAFAATINVDNSLEDSPQIEQILMNALDSVGMSLFEFNCVITGKDSVEVNQKLSKKMALFEEIVGSSGVDIIGDVEVRGGKKALLHVGDSKEQVIYTWYEKEFGMSETGSWFPPSKKYLHGLFSSSKHYNHRVTSISVSSSSSDGDDYITLGKDMNDDAGGEYIYLQFHYDNYGKGITNVVAIYSTYDLDNSTDIIYIGGKKYYRPQGMTDLNDGCGKGTYYIYLYVTNDGSDEEATLNTGNYGQNNPFALYHGSDFSAYDHRDNKRIVHAYYPDGSPVIDDKKHHVEADMNASVNAEYIKLALYYK